MTEKKKEGREREITGITNETLHLLTSKNKECEEDEHSDCHRAKKSKEEIRFLPIKIRFGCFLESKPNRTSDQNHYFGSLNLLFGFDFIVSSRRTQQCHLSGNKSQNIVGSSLLLSVAGFHGLLSPTLCRPWWSLSDLEPVPRYKPIFKEIMEDEEKKIVGIDELTKRLEKSEWLKFKPFAVATRRREEDGEQDRDQPSNTRIIHNNNNTLKNEFLDYKIMKDVKLFFLSSSFSDNRQSIVNEIPVKTQAPKQRGNGGEK
ncbi:unnamed protein product [Camellia sinensis]